MFLNLSVILFTGGEGGVHPPGRHPLADTPLGRRPPVQTHPRQTPPQADLRPPEMTTTADGYASYWNALLLVKRSQL